MWRFDMHCHTQFSPDCFMAPETFVAAARKAGLDAVFITDHERQDGARAIRDAARGSGLTVFTGQEIGTRDGEIIALFASEWIPPGLTPEETLERVHAQGALAYLPHPFARLVPSRMSRKRVKALAESFDIVEVANARNILRRDDRKAAAFADEHGLLKGAGSDAHWPWEFGRTFVEAPPFDSAAALKESLRDGRVIDRAKSSYLLSGFNAAVYPLREGWWNLTGDPRRLPRKQERASARAGLTSHEDRG